MNQAQLAALLADLRTTRQALVQAQARFDNVSADLASAQAAFDASKAAAQAALDTF